MKKKITAMMFLLAMSTSAYAARMECTSCYITPEGTITCKVCVIGPRD